MDPDAGHRGSRGCRGRGRSLAFYFSSDAPLFLETEFQVMLIRIDAGRSHVGIQTQIVLGAELLALELWNLREIARRAGVVVVADAALGEIMTYQRVARTGGILDDRNAMQKVCMPEQHVTLAGMEIIRFK